MPDYVNENGSDNDNDKNEHRQEETKNLFLHNFEKTLFFCLVPTTNVAVKAA